MTRLIFWILCLALPSATFAAPVARLTVGTADRAAFPAASQAALGCPGGVCLTRAPIDAVAKRDPTLRIFPGRVEGGWAPFALIGQIEIEVRAVSVERDARGHAIATLEFTAPASEAISDLTATNIGRRLALIADGAVMLAPRVNERISGGSAVLDLGVEVQPLDFLATLRPVPGVGGLAATR